MATLYSCYTNLEEGGGEAYATGEHSHRSPPPPPPPEMAYCASTTTNIMVEVGPGGAKGDEAFAYTSQEHFQPEKDPLSFKETSGGGAAAPVLLGEREEKPFSSSLHPLHQKYDRVASEAALLEEALEMGTAVHESEAVGYYSATLSYVAPGGDKDKQAEENQADRPPDTMVISSYYTSTESFEHAIAIAAAKSESASKHHKRGESSKQQDGEATKTWERQWNEEYQRLMGRGLRNLVPEEVCKVARLSHDFVTNAEHYAKIIINELNVPSHLYLRAAPQGSSGDARMYTLPDLLPHVLQEDDQAGWCGRRGGWGQVYRSGHPLQVLP